MLPLFRHLAKPIMIALAVVICVAFIFFTGNTRDDYAAGPNIVLKAYDKEYTLIDVERIERTYSIAAQLGLPGLEPGGSYASDIVFLKFNYGDQQSGWPLRLNSAPVDYIPNLLVLRDSLKKYGIRASDAEVQEVFRGLGRFQVNGVFDRDLALEFERSLSNSGLDLADVYEVIRDSLGLRKLRQLVSGNVVVNPKVPAEVYVAGAQTIKAASIPFPLEDFKKKAKVTDEEITKYFEENKDQYRSPEKRAVTYVMITKPNTEGKNAADTVKIDKEHMDKLISFADAIARPEANLEAEAKKAGFEAKTAPAFSEADAPEPLKSEQDLLRRIFLNDPKKLRISDPIEVEKGHVAFAVTDIVAPAPQELKDVKEKVREELVAKKAAEDMQKAANDAKKKLEEALAAGKKFDDAAKEAGLTPQVLPEFSPSAPIAELSNGQQISREAMDTPAGALTKPINTPSGVILVYVMAKELRKSEDSSTRKKNVVTRMEQGVQSDLFEAWFNRRYEEATIQADRLLQIAMSSR